MKQENLYEPGCIRTHSGLYVDILNPTPDKIIIEDIAHSLAQQPRFGGHLHKPFSVAQHSIGAAMAVAPEHRLAALLHDASEAYLVDLPSPIKKLLPDYYKIEERFMQCIACKFQFQFPLHPEVKRQDEVELNWEWYNHMLSKKQGVWPFAKAKSLFLKIFKEVSNPNFQ